MPSAFLLNMFQHLIRITMSKQQNFADLMPALFSEVNEASHIRFLFRCGSDVDIFTGTHDAKVVSVNGFSSPKKFGQHMKQLGNKLFDKAREAQADFPRRDRLKFLEEVGRTLSSLVKVVSLLPSGEVPAYKTAK